jgi:hypothetical protein
MPNLAEALLLLSVHDERAPAGPPVSTGLAASILTELIVRERVRVDVRHLEVVGRETTRDSVLDLVLTRMRHTPARGLAYWLNDLRDATLDVRGRLLDRLVRRGMLTREERVRGAAAGQNSSPHRDLRHRVRRVLLGDERGEPRLRLLAVTLLACGSADLALAASDRVPSVLDEMLASAVDDLVDDPARRPAVLRELRAVHAAVRRLA